ncbi:MAG: Asp/Glu/hydantoin racemase [Pelagibacterium sp. SCN 63-23]|nr:MAG: Asp/Glu/hydantoin racemase [Pelagibacterium sp. SCN 63-23]
MSAYHSFDPAEGHRLRHDPINAIIAPRPIGRISSVSPSGALNLAPYSYFNIISLNPPIVMFASEGRKDTVNNVELSGEFVVNLATRNMAEAMSLTSGRYDPEVNEFILAGLEAVSSDVVSAPRVGGVAAAMECRLIEIRRLRDMDGNAVSSHLVAGQIVRVHIDQQHLVDGMFDLTHAQTIARCGYQGDYVEATSIFQILRPRT